MKKFFALVLALVMALSLTTVAWGAMDAATLQAAIDAVADGASYELPESVDLGATVLKINKGITLDLGNNTITGEIEINTTAPVTIKNGAITNAAAQGRCIDTRVGADLTINDVVLTTTGSGNTQPLTIGADGDFSVKVTVKDSTINAGTAGYAIINFHKTELTIDHSSLNGYAAIYMKDGSNGSVVTIKNGSTLTGYGHAGASNAFGTIVFETDGIEVNIENGSTIDNEGDTTQQKLFEINGNTDNIVTVPAEYADDLAAEGYVVTANSDGSVSIAGISAPAPAGGTALPALYDMVTTDAAKTKTLNVTVTTYAAKAPYDADESDLIDADNERGCVKHFMFSNLPGKYFVKVNTVGEADYTVYVAGTKTLFGHFNEVEDPYYYGTAVPFNNFGKNCEQFKYTPVVGTKYYIFQSVVFEAVEAGGEITLMVGNKLTGMDAVNGNFVEHIASYTYNDKFEVTAVKCGVCGKPATIVPNYASLPDDVTSYGPINEKMYYYWGATVVTPSTDKVQSAETFDAGIAMYVGMSVMAAAGSAVVIGKKKD